MKKRTEPVPRPLHGRTFTTADERARYCRAIEAAADRRWRAMPATILEQLTDQDARDLAELWYSDIVREADAERARWTS